mmetsp:Transcript_12691/g.32544  ORF Transcript_12691/g.32544 Transcript_12691/m.32544 type:complete len:92 (+) Transcript_12691:194-469(+)
MNAHYSMTSGKQAPDSPQKMDTNKQEQQLRAEAESGGNASAPSNSSESASPLPPEKLEKQVEGVPQAKDDDDQLRAARTYSKEHEHVSTSS